MIRTLRISHPALFGIKTAETLRFYTELPGMELVLRQPNLDDASMEHLFFHVGEDNFIAYFLPYDEQTAASKFQRMKPGYGGMNHLAIDVNQSSFDEALTRLQAEGVHVIGPTDRDYERSIYFRDANGVRIELLVWLTQPPVGLPQVEIIRRAQRLREARGASFVEDRDVREAIAELQQGRRHTSHQAT